MHVNSSAHPHGLPAVGGNAASHNDVSVAASFAAAITAASKPAGPARSHSKDAFASAPSAVSRSGSVTAVAVAILLSVDATPPGPAAPTKPVAYTAAETKATNASASRSSPQPDTGIATNPAHRAGGFKAPAGNGDGVVAMASRSAAPAGRYSQVPPVVSAGSEITKAIQSPGAIGTGAAETPRDVVAALAQAPAPMAKTVAPLPDAVSKPTRAPAANMTADAPRRDAITKVSQTPTLDAAAALPRDTIANSLGTGASPKATSTKTADLPKLVAVAAAAQPVPLTGPVTPAIMSVVLPHSAALPPSATADAPVARAAAPAPVQDNVAATPAALAASITAMHRNGQTSAMLRLDPPGLGTLSVHIALGADQGSGGGQVNLLLLPAIAQTGQILNGGIDGLRQALAAAGLTLGQAQIGHGGGQNGAPDHEGGQARLATRMPAAGMSGADEIARPGVRAYA